MGNSSTSRNLMGKTSKIYNHTRMHNPYPTQDPTPSHNNSIHPQCRVQTNNHPTPNTTNNNNIKYNFPSPAASSNQNKNNSDNISDWEVAKTHKIYTNILMSLVRWSGMIIEIIYTELRLSKINLYCLFSVSMSVGEMRSGMECRR